MNTLLSIPSHQKCFGCGKENNDGLRLEFLYGDGKAHCRARLDPRFQSYPGIVHGGILASIADSVMVNLVHHLIGGEPKTCRLDLRLRKSVDINEEIFAEAEILRVRQKFIWASCKIGSGDQECASANGTFGI